MTKNFDARSWTWIDGSIGVAGVVTLAPAGAIAAAAAPRRLRRRPAPTARRRRRRRLVGLPSALVALVGAVAGHVAGLVGVRRVAVDLVAIVDVVSRRVGLDRLAASLRRRQHRRLGRRGCRSGSAASSAPGVVLAAHLVGGRGRRLGLGPGRACVVGRESAAPARARGLSGSASASGGIAIGSVASVPGSVESAAGSFGSVIPSCLSCAGRSAAEGRAHRWSGRGSGVGCGRQCTERTSGVAQGGDEQAREPGQRPTPAAEHRDRRDPDDLAEHAADSHREGHRPEDQREPEARRPGRSAPAASVAGTASGSG